MKDIHDDPAMPAWMRSPPKGKKNQRLSSSGESQRLLPGREFRGPLHPRKFTDIFFLVLFLLFWIGMLILGYASLSGKSIHDSWKRIVEGIDYKGHPCGTATENMDNLTNFSSNLPNHLSHQQTLNNLLNQVPYSNSLHTTKNNNTFLYFPDITNNPSFGICIDQCPQTNTEKIQATLRTVKEDVLVIWRAYPTRAQSYFCAPLKEQLSTNDQLSDTMGRLIASLGESPLVFFVGIALAVGTSLLYVILLSVFGGILLALSTISVQGALLAGGYALWQRAKQPNYQNDPTMKQSLQIASLGAFCGSIVFFFLVIFMAKRFMLASSFISYGNKALSQMKQIILVPLLNIFLLLVLFTWGLLVTVCIFSSGKTTHEIVTVQAYSPSSVEVAMEKFVIDTNLRLMFFYHLWGLYWTATFILAIGELIVAIAISIWYFSPEKETDSFSKEMDCNPVSLACRATFKYHLGTLAFGSAIVSIVHYFRSFLLYLQDKQKNNSNGIVNVVYHCCCCCLWCLDNCLKYVSREAYYITAINGTNFYTSANTAYGLIASNLLRVGALDILGYSAVFLGKLIVCTSSCFTCWFLLSDVSSPVIPLLAICIISYFIGYACLTVYETAINALLMCFLVDEDMHGGQGRGTYISKTFVKSVDDHLRPRWQTSM